MVRPLVLDWHTGERAGALAQYFGVELLPGAVLVPPYCKATECEVSWVDWFTSGLGSQQAAGAGQCF